MRIKLSTLCGDLWLAARETPKMTLKMLHVLDEKEREEGENEAPRRDVGHLKRELNSSWCVVQIASHTLLLPTSRKRNVTTKI